MSPSKMHSRRLKVSNMDRDSTAPAPLFFFLPFVASWSSMHQERQNNQYNQLCHMLVTGAIKTEWKPIHPLTFRVKSNIVRWNVPQTAQQLNINSFCESIFHIICFSFLFFLFLVLVLIHQPTKLSNLCSSRILFYPHAAPSWTKSVVTICGSDVLSKSVLSAVFQK